MPVLIRSAPGRVFTRTAVFLARSGHYTNARKDLERVGVFIVNPYGGYVSKVMTESQQILVGSENSRLQDRVGGVGKRLPAQPARHAPSWNPECRGGPRSHGRTGGSPVDPYGRGGCPQYAHGTDYSGRSSENMRTTTPSGRVVPGVVIVLPATQQGQADRPSVVYGARHFVALSTGGYI